MGKCKIDVNQTTNQMNMKLKSMALKQRSSSGAAHPDPLDSLSEPGRVQLPCSTLSGWCLKNPSEKYDFVNGDDQNPNSHGKIKLMATKPPTSYVIYVGFLELSLLERLHVPDSSRFIRISPADQKVETGRHLPDPRRHSQAPVVAGWSANGNCQCCKWLQYDCLNH